MIEGERLDHPRVTIGSSWLWSASEHAPQRRRDEQQSGRLERGKNNLAAQVVLDLPTQWRRRSERPSVLVATKQSGGLLWERGSRGSRRSERDRNFDFDYLLKWENQRHNEPLFTAQTSKPPRSKKMFAIFHVTFNLIIDFARWDKGGFRDWFNHPCVLPCDGSVRFFFLTLVFLKCVPSASVELQFCHNVRDINKKKQLMNNKRGTGRGIFLKKRKKEKKKKCCVDLHTLWISRLAPADCPYEAEKSLSIYHHGFPSFQILATF